MKSMRKVYIRGYVQFSFGIRRRSKLGSFQAAVLLLVNSTLLLVNSTLLLVNSTLFYLFIKFIHSFLNLNNFTKAVFLTDSES